ncbi:MAG: DUF2924 domain-containing protein [Alphaproteobacteria bacterium]
MHDDGSDVGAIVRAASREALSAAWPGGDGRPPPGARRQLLELAAAWSIQAKRHGGLQRPTLAKLKRLADGGDGPDPARSRQAVEPGTRLVREWNGRTHVVDATPDGFVYAGETYRSLSAVARAITGARWSGPRFFGLDRQAQD